MNNIETAKLLQKLKDSINNQNASYETISALDLYIDSICNAYQEELETHKEALRQMKEVTAFLGKGVAKLAPPDGFFEKWSKAEYNADILINQSI